MKETKDIVLSIRITEEHNQLLEEMMEKYGITKKSTMVRILIEDYDKDEYRIQLEKVKELVGTFM